MHDELKFSDVIYAVKSWFCTFEKQVFFSKDKFQIAHDDNDCFQVFLEFKNCLGEIMVNQPEFAPYRFVKIEVSSFVNNHAEFNLFLV